MLIHAIFFFFFYVETEPLIHEGADPLIHTHFPNFQEAGSVPRMQSGML